MYSSCDRIILVLAGSGAEGGMFNYLCCWIAELRRAGVAFAVSAPLDVVPSLQRRYGDTVDIIALPYDLTRQSLPALYRDLAFGRRNLCKSDFLRSVVAFAPTHIHIVDETIFFPFFSLALGRGPWHLVITVHDPIYHVGQFRALSTRVAAFLGRIAYVFTPNVILHLHGLRCLRPSIPWLISSKIVHPHPRPERLSNRCRRFAQDGVVNIGFLGRLESYKGIDILIAAVKIFEAITANPPIKLAIVGRGRFDERLCATLRSDVELINRFVSEEEFHEKLAEQDVIVLPYTAATQSGVGYLAKAYNKSLVCSNVGNLPDLIETEDDGIVFDPITAEALSSALYALIQKRRYG